MEKNVVDHFEKVLSNKGGSLSLNSFGGHLSELSQKERKHIKNLGGLEKFLVKHPHKFMVVGDDVYLIREEIRETSHETNTKQMNSSNRELMVTDLKDTKSSVNLESAKDDPCTVCSDPIDIYAIGDCRHPICFRCSTKLRVLCEDNNCPVCRRKLDEVVFTKQLLPIDECDTSRYPKEKKHGILYETREIYEQKKKLLMHICPKCPNTVFDAFESLEAHAKDKHQLHYCYICVRQCKIFTAERRAYSKSELKEHIQGGGAGSSSEGHPLCQFCEHRYLDNDELLRHLRLHHCSCRICDQENEGHYQFYLDKNSLLEHQRENHFPCEHPDCLELNQIPAFKEAIDLQSHNLQYHSGQKSKSEKRAEQRINVPLTFDKKKEKVKKIVNVVEDASGGINVTGVVTWRVERMYSFIERDDKGNQFEENVFFDLEAAGLDPHDDLRNHFKSGDRVSAYARPCGNPYAKSKWKAQYVEKLENDDEDNFATGIATTTIPGLSQMENSPFDFPSLAPVRVPTQSTPALAGWSKLAQANPAAFSVLPSVTKTKKVHAQKHEIGYIHKNLQSKFGFIQRKNNMHDDAFENNIYFNLDSFVFPPGEYKSDLTSVLSIGDKVCFILHEGPINFTTKSKYRARYVWKYSPNADLLPILPDADGFQTVSGAKIKPPAEKPISIPSTQKIAVLTEKFKKKMGIETKGVIVSNDAVYGSGRSSPGNIATPNDMWLKAQAVAQTRDAKKNSEPVKSRSGSKTSLDLGEKDLPQQSMLGELSAFGSNFKLADVNSSGSQSQLAQVFNQNGLSQGSTNHASSISSPTYQSTDEDSSDDEDSDDEGEEVQPVDPNHKIFMDALGVCLNNHRMFEILRNKILAEMKKQGVLDQTQLQFIELRKEDNSAHILFRVNKGGGDNGRTGYAKFDGFYLDASKLKELTAKRMATKITRELYTINGSSHYITLVRSKSEKNTRITLHYDRGYCATNGIK